MRRMSIACERRDDDRRYGYFSLVLCTAEWAGYMLRSAHDFSMCAGPINVGCVEAVQVLVRCNCVCATYIFLCESIQCVHLNTMINLIVNFSL